MRPTKTDVEYIEPFLPKEKLIIAGAGHIGAALCKLAAALDFEVTVIDDRFTFANRERLPDAAQIIVDDPAVALCKLPIDADTYIVIVTRGHRHDAVVLREAIVRPTAYLGMIGSKRKVRIIYQQFLEEGIATEAQLKRIHSPMGLNIGSETVNEIAVSIAAELIQVRAQSRNLECGDSSPLSNEPIDRLAKDGGVMNLPVQSVPSAQRLGTHSKKASIIGI